MGKNREETEAMWVPVGLCWVLPLGEFPEVMIRCL